MKLLLSIVCCSCVFGTSVIAQPRSEGAPSPDHKFGAMMREKLGERLGLSQEQREKLKSFKADHDQQEQNHEKLEASRTELRNMLEKDSASDEEILKQASQVSKMMTDENMQRVQRMLAIRKILSPEQRTKFREFMDEHRGEHGRFRPDDGSSSAAK